MLMQQHKKKKTEQTFQKTNRERVRHIQSNFNGIVTAQVNGSNPRRVWFAYCRVPR